MGASGRITDVRRHSIRTARKGASSAPNEGCAPAGGYPCPMPNSHRRAALALVMASVLFSTGGAAIKAVEFSGWQIASLRSGIAGLTLLLLVPAARRGWGWRPGLVGAAYAATCIC